MSQGRGIAFGKYSLSVLFNADKLFKAGYLKRKSMSSIIIYLNSRKKPLFHSDRAGRYEVYLAQLALIISVNP